MKALKRALKCVPSSLDKNERFQTVSTLVGGGRSKKECYSKYKVRRDRKTKGHGTPLAAARTFDGSYISHVRGRDGILSRLT